MEMVDVLSGLALLGLTLGFGSFCLLFHVLADWRSTEMGRHVMSFMATCTVILLYSWISFAFEIPMWVRSWVRLVLFGILLYVVWRRVWILIRIQKEARIKNVSELWGQDD